MLMDFLKSGNWGNLIGIISLFIGLISFCLTIKTLKKAKEIQEEIRQGKISAIDKVHFNNTKTKVDEELFNCHSQLSNTQLVSYKTAKQIYTCLCRLCQYDAILNTQDFSRTKELQLQQELICREIEKGNRKQQIPCIAIIEEIRGIINKGEYGI